MVVMPSGARTPEAWPLLWAGLGCLLQLLVFTIDLVTPLGFAHSVLYAPVVLLGLLGGRHWTIWTVAAVGMAGLLAAFWLVDERLPGVTYPYIVFNRALGGAMTLAAAVGCSVLLRLLAHRDQSRRALVQVAGLLEVSSAVGRLGGWRVSLPDRTSYWSSQVFELLDQPPGEVPGLEAVVAMCVPAHQARLRGVFRDCVAHGRPFDEELQVVDRQGGRRWLRVVGQAELDGDGQVVGVQGAIQDIAGYKAIQADLENNRAEWRQLAESLPMMVWAADGDGRVTYMNAHTGGYLGSPVDVVLGERWLEFLHPDDRDGLLQRWRQAVLSGQGYQARFRVRRHDGAWRWHVGRAVRVERPDGGWRWYGTAVDVQDQMDEAQARMRLAGRLAETMENVTDAIFVLDADWRFTYLNRQAEAMLERHRDDLLSRKVWEEFPAARGTIFQREYERCAREEVTVRFDAPYAPLGKHFEVTAYPDAGGVAVYFRDITESRRLAEQLDQAQRMDALGQLTGGVAHDFNNLLTVILANAELLVEQTDGDLRAMAAMVGAAANRGAEMTQRLLAFARKQALEPSPTDVGRLVAEFVPLLNRSLGEHIEVVIACPDALWPAQVDPGQLETALLNLAVNSRDAMPGGGTLTIEAANVTLDADDAHRYGDLVPGRYVALAVSDTGHGIPPEVLTRVFEPFFTTKEVGRGTGLGLPMVYGFARQSRGHATIYSEPGRGTTIRIYLPAAAAAEAAAPSAEDEPPDPGQGRLVLLVEDDEMVRTVAARQVESLGYRVLQASNGPAALALLRAHPGVDLLFTDVVMPGGMTGRQLADAARELRPGLPVLYTSGYTENAIVHQGRLDPGVLLLGKPYPRAELARKLQMALAGRGAEGGR